MKKTKKELVEENKKLASRVEVLEGAASALSNYISRKEEEIDDLKAENSVEVGRFNRIMRVLGYQYTSPYTESHREKAIDEIRTLVERESEFEEVLKKLERWQTEAGECGIAYPEELSGKIKRLKVESANRASAMRTLHMEVQELSAKIEKLRAGRRSKTETIQSLTDYLSEVEPWLND